MKPVHITSPGAAGWLALRMALRFYQAVGAQRMDQLVVHRVQGDAIGVLAKG